MAEIGIREFFKGKSVFITGGSGFMGKVLIEKLLYSCSDINEIFLLMRPKRGKSGEQRVQEFAQIPVFHRIKDRLDLLNKIVPVYGDITNDRLGLSDEQYNRVITTTNVVFHLAASLKLEATLKPNVEMNLTGTKNVLDMCKEMPKLLAVLHLSTAFCNCDQDILYEEIYDWPQKPLDLIKCSTWMSEEAMHEMGKSMMSPHPNTYTFTKRLAEILVRDEYDQGKLNVCVVRPSIVTPAWKEPLPGWVDSLNGPIGIMVAGGKGVLRSMICEANYTAEVIPVDQAINGIISIAYIMGTMKERPSKIPVYNITCSEKKRVTWGTVLNDGKRINYEYPFDAGLWYPNGDVTMNYVKHYLTLFFCQWIPALLIDFLMLIFFQPRFMIRVQKKIFIGLGVLQFFTTRNWDFRSENFKAIHHKLSPEEKIIFNTNTEEVEQFDYLKSIILGGRQYCLKEPLENLPRARFHQRIQYVVDILFKCFLIYYIGKWLLRITGLLEILNGLLSTNAN
ncbi:hypothetical protein PVAND_005969 [Polypedilum vanderplanki]|uniref:Fatty acyl-CoA reductase n=1 Tax=Polypedilum vanderplanki TaxID=319348 RepID=A0A9J6C2S7_POLVA|nr:hypothetical protein PVAND_005969 [Polypedilum vanderplanki]